LSWEAFYNNNKTVAEAVARDHPGAEGDKKGLTRANLKTKVKRLLNWIEVGKGKCRRCSKLDYLITAQLTSQRFFCRRKRYPKKFARDVGLIDATSNGKIIACLRGNPGSDYSSNEESNDLSSGKETPPFTDAKSTPKRYPETPPRDIRFDDFIAADFDASQVTDSRPMLVYTSAANCDTLRGESVDNHNYHFVFAQMGAGVDISSFHMRRSMNHQV
jgi:hypothetical protein